MAAAENDSSELLADLGFDNAADIEALRGFVCRPLGEMPARSTSVRNADMVKGGLEPVFTLGDGNCFFAAISDQLHGDFTHADGYRALSVQHVQLNKEKYIDFMVVNEGGGIRRQPKRKNAGGYSVSIDHGAPTADARELQFHNELQHMAKNGTFADEIQIRALAEALQINIRIYETNYTRDIDGAPGLNIQIATIAYNRQAEHYQSVRKIGTHKNGPPKLEFRIAEEITESIESQSPARPMSAPSGHLLPEQLTRSRSSTPGSISIERDHDDDDDDEPVQPAKRSARARITRAAKSRKPSSLSQRISVAATPTALSSRAASPESVIFIAATGKEKTDKCENTPPSTSATEIDSTRTSPVVHAKSPSLSPSTAATTLLTPPQTGSSSPSPVVITIEDAEKAEEEVEKVEDAEETQEAQEVQQATEEEEDIPLSPRRLAQRRRSSRANERARAAIMARIQSPEDEKASKKASSPTKLKTSSQGKRTLRRGLRNRKTSEETRV